MNVIKALIPMRSGSLRVENKNTRSFAGRTLLEWKIAELQKVKSLNGIVVNTNDPKAIEIANDCGVEVVIRDSKFATNEVSMNDVYFNMASNMEADIIVHTPVTSPFLKAASVEEAIAKYLENRATFDSLNSVSDVKEFLVTDKEPINFSLEEIPRSQDLPDIYCLNWAISVIDKGRMLERRSVVGNKPSYTTLTGIEGFDIDTPLQFSTAEILFLKNLDENR